MSAIIRLSRRPQMRSSRCASREENTLHSLERPFGASSKNRRQAETEIPKDSKDLLCIEKINFRRGHGQLLLESVPKHFTRYHRFAQHGNNGIFVCKTFNASAQNPLGDIEVALAG